MKLATGSAGCPCSGRGCGEVRPASSFPAGCQFLVDDGEQIRLLDQIAAPLHIQIIEGMGGDELLLGLAGGDGLGHPRAHFAQHSLVLAHIFARSRRARARE